MKLNKLTQLTAISAALVGSASFAASNDALLDLLVKKGVLTDTEATAVAAELKEENKGVTFSAKGKETIKLRFNGRMQFQYDSLDADYAGTDTASTNHFYFRRLFFGVKANLDNGVYAETVFDLAEEEFGFETVYFGYEFDDKLDVQLGYKKVPFGFEETSSSASLPTIERSVANRFFADDIDFSARHTGIHAQGNLGAGFSYAIAAVNGAQGEGSRLLGKAESSNDMALFGRLQWESNGFTLGVDAGNQSNNDVVGSDVTAFTGYANYKVDGLNLLGEFFSADMDDAGDVDGYALRASYKINKFEPVIRYSHLETDGFVIDMPELIRRAPEPGSPVDTIPGGDNELDSFYFGVNYYYSPAVTFLAGYEIAEGEAENGDEYDVDGFRARVQVLW
jgi:phosphate-selective porin OprO and OprP